jgi:hypothetical protein
MDPRKHVRAADRRSRNTGLGLTFEDFKVPVYVLSTVGIVLILYFIIGRPLLTPRMERRTFERCLDHMRDVRIALEKNFDTHNSYSISGLYKHMKKPTDIDVEAYVDETCQGHRQKEWTLLDDIDVSPKAYRVYGTAPTRTPCPIIMTKSSYWPQEYRQCGTPPPAGLMDE